MRFEPRERIPHWLRLLAPLLAIAAALAICSVLVLWAGAGVGEAYRALIKGAVGSRFALSETLTRATPLIFTGLAAAVAFRAKLWNIGGEGQLYAGALAVTWVGTGAVALPSPASVLLLFVPTLLKTHLRVDEVVTTLLLNFVMLLFVDYLLFGPWKDPMALGWPQAAPIVEQGVLPVIVPKTRLHAGLVFAVAAALGIWLVMRFTRWGFEIRAVGLGVGAARFAGIPLNATVIRTALLSGGLAACAGVTEVCGTKGYLTADISPGFGYTGIAVAMLAGLHPLGVVAAALFIAGIYNGADSMSRAMSISSYLADVITATTLLLVLVSGLVVQFRIRRG